jgi:hypothetical protein
MQAAIFKIGDESVEYSQKILIVSLVLTKQQLLLMLI